MRRHLFRCDLEQLRRVAQGHQLAHAEPLSRCRWRHVASIRNGLGTAHFLLPGIPIIGTCILLLALRWRPCSWATCCHVALRNGRFGERRHCVCASDVARIARNDRRHQSIQHYSCIVPWTARRKNSLILRSFTMRPRDRRRLARPHFINGQYQQKTSRYQGPFGSAHRLERGGHSGQHLAKIDPSSGIDCSCFV